jgi:transposase
MLVNAGVTYIFLPTYSPELNPCKLIFAFLKHMGKPTTTIQLPELVIEALSILLIDQLVHFYDHCVNIKDRIK